MNFDEVILFPRINCLKGLFEDDSINNTNKNKIDTRTTSKNFEIIMTIFPRNYALAITNYMTL